MTTAKLLTQLWDIFGKPFLIKEYFETKLANTEEPAAEPLATAMKDAISKAGEGEIKPDVKVAPLLEGTYSGELIKDTNPRVDIGAEKLAKKTKWSSPYEIQQ